MQGFEKISPSEFSNAFDRIGKDWMLISASDGERANTMTASWGGIGILWNKPVVICFIRPQRFTCPMVEASEMLSFAFLGEEHRAALQYCGRHSGREGDKFSAAGLTLAYANDGVPYPAEATEVLICKKLFQSEMKEADFLDPSLLSHYPTKDYHKVFVCEIVEVLQRK